MLLRQIIILQQDVRLDLASFAKCGSASTVEL